MYSRKRAIPPLLRRTALFITTLFAWSLLAPTVGAVTYRPPTPAGHVRALTPAEMQRIVGAQESSPSHALSAEPDSGSTYPWEGSYGNVNTGNGNKLTDLPLVGWTARGGLPVGFTLYHNSQGNHNSELGHKWTHSYDIYLVVDGSTGNATMHWGNDLSYIFTKNVDGSFSAPTGIHDTLVASSGAYELTTKGQITYRFTNPGGAGWHCVSIKDRNANTVTITRNGSGFVTSITDPTSRSITLGYDASNRITSVTDPLSRQWSLAYNANGELSQVTYPAVGASSFNVQFGYDANHRITTFTDRRGKLWTFGYNADGSIAWQKDPLLNQTSYGYGLGQTSITDANGNATYHNYSSGKLSSVQDAAGHTESYSYDSAFNKTGVTDKRLNSWSYTFDSRGNVLTATDPLLHTTTNSYNSKNDVTSVRSHLGSVVENTYDTAGNLTQTDKKNASGTVLSRLSYMVNSNGQITAKTDSNSHTTSYGYNTNGHLTSVTTHNGRVTGFGYNGLGIKTSRTDALGRTTNYTLDNWLRVTTVDYPLGTDHTFAYDAGGNVTQFTDATGTTTRAFDDANRITSESKGGSTAASYSYDAIGQKGLLSTLTDADNRVITYNYTNRNQLLSVAETAGTTSYSYDAAGNETGITNANGTTVTKTYDAAGRLTSLVNANSGGTTLSSFAYGYDDDNRRTSCTEANGDVVSYGYDGAGRLTSESRTGANAYTASYTLDGVNRTSQTVGGLTTSFTYSNDDELTGTSGGFTNSYGYNANGEQTSRTLGGTGYTLAYDYEGQLTSISAGGSVQSSYSYDAMGRRVSRTAGGTTTAFLRVGDTNGGQVLLEKQGGTTTRTYTYGNALTRMNGETPLFDGLGSERTVTDATQAVTGTITFEGFGTTVASTGSSSNPYMFAATSGYRNDGDAGLSHVGARYYDAQVGRFITRDTYLDQHPYLYCDGDPVNRLDPSGHDYRPGFLGGNVVNNSSRPIQVRGEPGRGRDQVIITVQPGRSDGTWFDADQFFNPVTGRWEGIDGPSTVTITDNSVSQQLNAFIRALLYGLTAYREPDRR